MCELFSRYSSSSFGDESDDDVTISDVTGDEQATPKFHRLRKVHAKVKRVWKIVI